MDYKHLIEIAQNDLKQADYLLENFKKNKTIAQIELDLLLSKIRTIYDQVLLINQYENKEDVKVQTHERSFHLDTKETDSIELKKDQQVEPVTKNTPETIEPEKIKPKEIISEQKVEEENIASGAWEKEKELIKEPQEPAEINIQQKTSFEEPETDEEILNTFASEQELPATEEVKITKEEITEEPVKHVQERATQIVSDRFQNTVQFRNEKFAAVVNKDDVASKIQSTPIEDISKAININDRFLYTKELFGGNTKLYKDTIDYLNHAPDFDDAILYITNNFDWDPDNANVQKLLELVKRRHI